eukprot:2943230-Prymnesium_polylepis.1
MARYDAARTMGRPGVAACSVSSPSGKAIRSVVPCEMSLAADMMAKRSMSSMWYTSLPRGLTPASLAAMRLARWRMPSRPAKRSIASSFSVSSCSTRLCRRRVCATTSAGRPRSGRPLRGDHLRADEGGLELAAQVPCCGG